MSLDVYLKAKEFQIKKASSGIFIRKNGHTEEISQEEWNLQFPSITPVIYHEEERETNLVYSANITHNLVSMAKEAGIYHHLWRPEEINIEKANELIAPLKEGLRELKSNPEKHKTHNPKHGWGTYEGLVKFVEEYLNACYKYPDAEIEVCR